MTLVFELLSFKSGAKVYFLINRQAHKYTINFFLTYTVIVDSIFNKN